MMKSSVNKAAFVMRKRFVQAIALSALLVLPALASDPVFRLNLPSPIHFSDTGESSNGGETGGNGGSTAPTEVSYSLQTDTAYCAAGYKGNRTRTRTATLWSDQIETFGDWSDWNTSACLSLASGYCSTPWGETWAHNEARGIYREHQSGQQFSCISNWTVHCYNGNLLGATSWPVYPDLASCNAAISTKNNP